MNKRYMPRHFRKLLKTIAKAEVESLKVLEKEIEKLPRGRLLVTKRKGKSYFSNRTGGRNMGISKDEDLIYALARRRYLENLLREARDDAELAERVLKAVRGDLSKAGAMKILDLYAVAGLDVMRITCTEKQYKWFRAPFKSNESHPEELIHITNGGVKMRSKSERSIGNMLEKYGIPYRYEQALRVNVMWMNGVELYDGSGYKNYYPDFTIMLPNGEFIIWEHLGRSDMPGYRAHFAEKLAAYREGSHALKFDQLITTFESDIRDERDIERVIQECILRKMLW